MEDYPSNSNKSKQEPEKKIDPVVTGKVIRRKKPLGRKFAETFVLGNLKIVAGTVLTDTLIPAARDAIFDAINRGSEGMLYGVEQAMGASRRAGRNGRVSYNRISSGGPLSGRERSIRDEPRSRRVRAMHHFDDIILDTRVEAEEILDRLFDLISRYEQVTVAELLELLGEDYEYTDQKFGWNDIRGAQVRRVRDGYLLDLPRPEPLE